LDGLGFESRLGQIFFSSPKCPEGLLRPSSLLSNGYRGSFPGLKRSGRNVDHSHPSNAEVRNEWRYMSAPPICLDGVAGTILPLKQMV
jgi:hypothetical protein